MTGSQFASARTLRSRLATRHGLDPIHSIPSAAQTPGFRRDEPPRVLLKMGWSVESGWDADAAAEPAGSFAVFVSP